MGVTALQHHSNPPSQQLVAVNCPASWCCSRPTLSSPACYLPQCVGVRSGCSSCVHKFVPAVPLQLPRHCCCFGSGPGGKRGGAACSCGNIPPSRWVHCGCSQPFGMCLRFEQPCNPTALLQPPRRSTHLRRLPCIVKRVVYLHGSSAAMTSCCTAVLCAVLLNRPLGRRVDPSGAP